MALLVELATPCIPQYYCVLARRTAEESLALRKAQVYLLQIFGAEFLF